MKKADRRKEGKKGGGKGGRNVREKAIATQILVYSGKQNNKGLINRNSLLAMNLYFFSLSKNMEIILSVKWWLNIS